MTLKIRRDFGVSIAKRAFKVILKMEHEISQQKRKRIHTVADSDFNSSRRYHLSGVYSGSSSFSLEGTHK